VLDRRRLLKAGGLLAARASTFGAPAIVSRSAIALSEPTAGAAHPSLPPRPRLGREDVVFIEHDSPEAERYSASFNRRTQRTPKLRALCRTPKAIAALIEWGREHAVPFALRAGGHSFEGYSQSTELVIDTRLLNRVAFDPSQQVVHVGAGAVLADIYRVLGRESHAIPAGYCQSIGIAGLTLGGGIGGLTRSAGLTCDALVSLELVDAEGRRLTVDRQSHPDLFWACRGGGGGSFGVATRLSFSAGAVPSVIAYEIVWALPPKDAAGLMDLWQGWLPEAPVEISTVVYLWKFRDGKALIRLVGQSIGSEEQLRRALSPFTRQAQPLLDPHIKPQTFLEAANYFSAPDERPFGSYRFKSDVVSEPLPIGAFEDLFERLTKTRTGLSVSCEALGGAVSGTGRSETAFPHRDTLFIVQYTADLHVLSEARETVQSLSRLYEAIRSHTAGDAYVNYCDADLSDWPRAYWGGNLDRLKAIKRKYDPDNVFRHGQSVPLN